jgi:hypothetical protein
MGLADTPPPPGTIETFTIVLLAIVMLFGTPPSFIERTVLRIEIDEPIRVRELLTNSPGPLCTNTWWIGSKCREWKETSQ